MSGLFEEFFSQPAYPLTRSPADIIFLDRDGVINRFPGKNAYVTRWEEFEFLPRSIEAIRLLTEAGFEIVVVSNQGCVSRGLLTLEELQSMTRRMLDEVESRGGRISGVFYCIHQTADACDCKKPQTALIRQAIRGRPVDLEKVYFVGDSEEDVQTGRNAGCRTVLVLSGRTQDADLGAWGARPDLVKKDLWEAANWITQGKS